jgi:hypothetical protein
MRKMNVIRSRRHDLHTEEVNKIALSSNDDKRVIMDDGIHTLAHGHYATGGGYADAGGIWTDIIRYQI